MFDEADLEGIKRNAGRDRLARKREDVLARVEAARSPDLDEVRCEDPLHELRVKA